MPNKSNSHFNSQTSGILLARLAVNYVTFSILRSKRVVNPGGPGSVYFVGVVQSTFKVKLRINKFLVYLCD